MDIHKPKPWHGVREFGKELVTIVAGVLIALAGEQAVEWSHHRSEVAEAREALRSEVAQDMMKALYNQARETCQQRELPQWLAWAHGGPRPPPGNGRFLTLESASWEAVKAGPVAFMPLKERLAYSRFYSQVGDYNAMAERERSAGLRFAENLSPRTPGPEDAGIVVKAATNLSNTEFILIGMANGIRALGDETGAKPAAFPERYASELHCNVSAPAAAAKGR